MTVCIVSKMVPPKLIAGEIFRGQEAMGLKNPRSHRSPRNICQGVRGLHHRDGERGSDKQLDLLHKILRHGEFASEEKSLGDTVG